MAVDSASNFAALNTALPAGSDPASELDNNIRHVKTLLLYHFPLFSGPLTCSHTELNYVTGVTSSIQTQINTKGAIAGQTWTGTHDFTGATISVPTATLPAHPMTKQQTEALAIASTAPTWTVTSTATSKTVTNYEFVYVTASGQTITFPASPVAGVTRVGVAFATGVTGTYDPNGQKIMGSSGTMTNVKPGAVLVFTYLNSTLGYVVGA